MTPRPDPDRAAERSVTGTLANMMSRWRDAPQPVRVAAAMIVVVLAYGTVAHVVDLLSSGFNPYSEAPTWLRTYWVALTVADPVAAVLLAWRTRAGVVLAVAVLVSDAAANGWANYALDPASGVTVGRVGHAVVTVLAIAVCATAPRLWRAAALCCSRQHQSRYGTGYVAASTSRRSRIISLDSAACRHDHADGEANEPANDGGRKAKLDDGKRSCRCIGPKTNDQSSNRPDQAGSPRPDDCPSPGQRQVM